MEWWNIEDPPEEDLNIEIQKRMMALYQILIRAFIVRSDLNPLNPTFQYSNIPRHKFTARQISLIRPGTRFSRVE
jgi:hypothetical protein